MQSNVKIWLPNENYWDMNPMAKLFKPFSEFHDTDKSKGKTKSSQIMWAVAMLLDPHEDNFVRNNSDYDKRILIATDYLDDADFDWEAPHIKTLIEAYTKFCVTTAERELIRYEEKLTDRANFLANTKYTMDSYVERKGGKWVLEKGTADQLDKMMLNTAKIFEQIETIKEKMNKEAAEGQLKGGATESASEAGTL